MLTKRDIDQEKIRLNDLKNVVETFEEIAAARMRKNRSSILNYRDFVSGLTTMFQEIKASYRHEFERLMKQQRGKNKNNLSLIKHNGKTVAVLLSSNTGLHGDLVRRTFNLFADYISDNTYDVVVVGRLGRLYFQQQFKNKKFTYFEFPDYKIDTAQLRVITQYLLQYEKIVVFFGNFKSITNQEARMLEIADLADLETQGSVQKVEFLSEPSIDKMVVFFEKEIFSSIIEQALHDSDLAKLASRMLSLDRSAENIRASLKKAEFEGRNMQYKIMNKKQQNVLSGISLWKG